MSPSSLLFHVYLFTDSSVLTTTTTTSAAASPHRPQSSPGEADRSASSTGHLTGSRRGSGYGRGLTETHSKPRIGNVFLRSDTLHLASASAYSHMHNEVSPFLSARDRGGRKPGPGRVGVFSFFITSQRLSVTAPWKPTKRQQDVSQKKIKKSERDPRRRLRHVGRKQNYRDTKTNYSCLLVPDTDLIRRAIKETPQKTWKTLQLSFEERCRDLPVT